MFARPQSYRREVALVDRSDPPSIDPVEAEVLRQLDVPLAGDDAALMPMEELARTAVGLGGAEPVPSDS